MGPLSIEQKLQQYNYNSSEATNTGPRQVHLGGFAISFKDMLQRVGVRLEQAFGVAEQSAELVVNNNNPQANDDDRDRMSNREASSNNNDNRGDRHRNDANATSSAEQRDSGLERSADNGHNSNSGHDRAGQTDTRGNDDHAPKDKADRSDASRKSDDISNTDTADASGDGGAAGDGANQNDANVKSQNTDGITTEQTAPSDTISNTLSLNLVSAIYGAGLISNAGVDDSKTGNVKTLRQTGKTQDVVDGPLTQATANTNHKGVHTAQGNKQLNANNQNANAHAGQQQVTNASDKGVNANIQDQAQQMSRLMGASNRANVSVNINTEQNQLTSRPTLTAANASILTPTTGNNGNAGTQAQTGQNQGQNAQTGAQAQAATQLQANANAQATAQVANQAQGTAGNIQTGPSTAGITTSAGGGQHGGGETLNTTTQTASAAQTAQQTQQTREAQPQQQTQQAQRGNAAGASVSDQISVKITKALQTGVDRISIQLRPAELGRVDVKLEMTHDGRVMTVVTAEKQDTLDLLRRDSSELQRALADAGLKNGDMEFNLKGQEQQTAEGDDAKNGDTSNQAEADNDDATDDPNDGVLTAWESGIFADGSVDMRA